MEVSGNADDQAPPRPPASVRSRVPWVQPRLRNATGEVSLGELTGVLGTLGTVYMLGNLVVTAMDFLWMAGDKPHQIFVTCVRPRGDA